MLVGDLVADLAHAEAGGKQRRDEVVEAGEAAAPGPHELGLEAAQLVAGEVEAPPAMLGKDGLAIVAVAGVARGLPLKVEAEFGIENALPAPPTG